MKLSRISIGVGVIVLLGILFLVNRNDPGTLLLKIRTIDEQNESFEIRAEYPAFPSFPKSFNRKIENVVMQNVAEFKKIGEENRELRKKNGDDSPSFPYTLSIGWTASQLGPKRVSFLLRASYYTGGAHGGESIKTFTFDAEKKEEVTLEDVFQDAPNYLNRISQFTQDELKDHLRMTGGGVEINMEMLSQGTAPLPKNFENFTLGPGNVITFYFPAYQVAAYAYGEQKVVMPLSYILAEDVVR